MRILLPVAILLLSSVARSAALPDSQTIGFTLEYYSLDQAGAAGLLAKHLGDGDEIRLQLTKLVDGGKAELLDSCYSQCRAGEESNQLLSISEFIYPTEYDPPYTPSKITGKVDPTVDLTIPSNPVAFDYRQTGSSAQVTFNQLAGGLLKMQLNTQLVDYCGNIHYASGPAEAQQPIFDSLGHSSTVIVNSGRWELLAMHVPRDTEKYRRDPNRRVLALGRATILDDGVGSAIVAAVVEKEAGVEPEPALRIGLLTETIRLETGKATELLRQHAGDHTRLHNEVAALVTNGEAQVRDSNYLLSDIGQRARVQSIHEFIYPTEYVPPKFGTRFQPQPQPAAEGEAGFGEGTFPIFPASLAAFDVRNIGSTLEFESNIDHFDNNIQVSIAPEIVRFVDFIGYGKIESLSQQPVFSVNKSRSALNTNPGEPALVSVQIPPHANPKAAESFVRPDRDHRLLTFTTASILSVSLDPKKKNQQAKEDPAMKPAAPRPHELGLLVEHIELDEAEATRLLDSGRGGIALRTRVAEAIVAGKAKIIESSYLLSREGQKAKLQTVHEYIYPTEWDPPQVLDVIPFDVTADMDLKLPATPTAFDVRSLGTTFEFLPSRRSQAQVSCERVALEKLNLWGDETEKISQPEFRVLRSDASGRFSHKTPVLLAMHTPREAGSRDRRVMVFATPIVKHHSHVAKRPVVEDPFERISRSDITAGIEYIEIAAAQLPGVLARIPHEADAESEAREFVAGLIKKGEAVINSSGAQRGQPGQRLAVEPIHEFIYPTEYDPPEIAVDQTKKNTRTVSAVPTAFDVRNLGATIEIEPQIWFPKKGQDAKDVLIELHLAVEETELVRQVDWGIEEAKCQQPLIGTQKLATSVLVRPGDEALAAVLTPLDPKSGAPLSDRRVLVFAWAQLAKKPAGGGGEQQPRKKQPEQEDPFR